MVVTEMPRLACLRTDGTPPPPPPPCSSAHGPISFLLGGLDSGGHLDLKAQRYGQEFKPTTVATMGVKTRLQVQIKQTQTDLAGVTDSEEHYHSSLDAIRKIVKAEGIEGLYSGINGSLIGVTSTNFAYFYWYSVIRTLYLSSSALPKPPGIVTELSLGAAAGAVAQIFTIPVSVITTRQQTAPKGQKKGLRDTGREVIEGDDGWTGLWRGLKASLVLVVNPAITYGAYQRLREILFAGKANLRPWESFALGALSKALATLVTQPLIVAKVGLQSRPPPARKGRPFKSFLEVMLYIIEHEGPLSLFKGVAPQVAKGVLVQGLLMMTKERSSQLQKVVKTVRPVVVK
ncbi:MAG: hypothetical protein Q9167_000847 [Letrouitia subvulpina]